MTEDVNKARRSAKICILLSTVIYVALFPYFLYVGFVLLRFAFEVFRESIFGSLLVLFLTLLTPFLSIPVSIYLMWSRYLRGQYEKARFFCALPVYTFIGAFCAAFILYDLQ